MKTISVDYNLQDLTQTPEATLSDLFILLYSIYLLEESGALPSRLALNKLYPFIFQKLEEANKLNKIQIFNLPFYKMDEGHYNKAIREKYLKKLLKSKLIKPMNDTSYGLTPKAAKMIKDYVDDKRIRKSREQFKKIVNDYSKTFLYGKKYQEIFLNLKGYSHNTAIEDEGKKISVHDLPKTDFKAIAYNSPDFKTGKVSNIVPEEYLEILAHEMQSSIEINEKDKQLAKKLLSTL
jgi:hypothetical protein